MDRFLTPKKLEGDQNIRPKTLDEYFGQEKTKDKLKIMMKSALMRGDIIDHLLLYGPPGLGKTTLSMIVAEEMGVGIKITSGPAIERPGDLAAILTSLKEGDVLFIDEIHRLARTVEEVLYPAMEDFALDILIGKGAGAKSIRLDLPKFTLIGATTRAGQLSAPLRDRFGVLCKLELYNEEELGKIIKRSANVLDIEVREDAISEMSKRARGTPRIVNRMLKRVRDYALVHGDGIITREIASNALKLLEVDELGLDAVDISLLKAIIELYDGGPVGIDNLAAATGEEIVTIEDIYEPYLMQIGFLMRTPRGRIVTNNARKHLGYQPKEEFHQIKFELEENEYE